MSNILKSYYSEDDQCWYLLDRNGKYQIFTYIDAPIEIETVHLPDIDISQMNSETLATFMLLQTYISKEGYKLWDFLYGREINEIKDVIEAVFEPCDRVDYEHLAESMFCYQNKII